VENHVDIDRRVEQNEDAERLAVEVIGRGGLAEEAKSL
jgi:hypothetical protein